VSTVTQLVCPHIALLRSPRQPGGPVAIVAIRGAGLEAVCPLSRDVASQLAADLESLGPHPRPRLVSGGPK
jgi:hypothetical protein